MDNTQQQQPHEKKNLESILNFLTQADEICDLLQNDESEFKSVESVIEEISWVDLANINPDEDAENFNKESKLTSDPTIMALNYDEIIFAVEFCFENNQEENLKGWIEQFKIDMKCLCEISLKISKIISDSMTNSFFFSDFTHRGITYELQKNQQNFLDSAERIYKCSEESEKNSQYQKIFEEHRSHVGQNLVEMRNLYNNMCNMIGDKK